MKLRRQLIKYLREMYLQDEADPTGGSKSIRELLGAAIEGLRALDAGVVPPLFAPIKGAHGPDPRQAERLRIRSVVIAERLKKFGGRTLTEAYELLSANGGVEFETIRTWRRLIKNDVRQRSLYLEELQDSPTMFFPPESAEATLLAEAERWKADWLAMEHAEMPAAKKSAKGGKKTPSQKAAKHKKSS